MSVTKQTYDFTVQRVVISSSKPVKAVMAALNSELNVEKSGMFLMRLLAVAKTRAELYQGITAMTEGKRDFLLFAAGSQAQWMNMYLSPEPNFRETIVYTIGNPLSAQELLKHDMAAGLAIPLKLLLQETESGGSKILYDLPSSIILAGGQPNAELKAALDVTDRQFEALVRIVLDNAN
ncbi:hypothetical protein BDW22DRAFT_1169493 [Trametopsis cervina]|nr:hypothetical protein BDW22DRAFT_1169493 [Trametopsis cervina]